MDYFELARQNMMEQFRKRQDFQIDRKMFEYETMGEWNERMEDRERMERLSKSLYRGKPKSTAFNNGNL